MNNDNNKQAVSPSPALTCSAAGVEGNMDMLIEKAYYRYKELRTSETWIVDGKYRAWLIDTLSRHSFKLTTYEIWLLQQ